MLSPILSLSVPSDALQAREDGLGNFTMCRAPIILPVQRVALQTYELCLSLLR